MSAAANTLRVVRAAHGVDAAAMARTLESPAWASTALVLKQDTDSWVRRGSLAGRDVAVKMRRLSPADRLKAAVGHSRADRHVRGAARLARAGVSTPTPLATLRGTLDNAPCEVLVCEFVPGPTLLKAIQALEGATAARQHSLARAAGQSVADLARAGLFNRDHKPSNLIVTGEGLALPRLVVLDTVAIRRDSGDRALARMLASLVIEPIGVGLAPLLRRPLLFRAALAAADHDRARARRLYRAAATIVREHADPTPRVNPLEIPLRPGGGGNA